MGKTLFFIINITKRQYFYIGELIDNKFQIYSDEYKDYVYINVPNEILDMIKYNLWSIDDLIDIINSNDLHHNHYFYKDNKKNLWEDLVIEGIELPKGIKP